MPLPLRPRSVSLNRSDLCPVPDGDPGNFVAVLPTAPPNLTVEYSQTTFYHWPQFSKNLTVDRGLGLNDGGEDADFETVAGSYFLFNEGDKLNKTEKQVRETAPFSQIEFK